MYKFLLIAACLAAAPAAAQTAITPKQFTMQPQAAFDWAKNVVGPILADYANNPAELPAVRNRIQKLSKLVTERRLDYRAEPLTMPGHPDLLAHTDYDRTAKLPVLMLFVPAVQAQQKKLSPKDFRDDLALVFAHEMIHYEQIFETHEFRLRVNEPWGIEGAKEEAAAFGKTIIEIVRPWAKQGRMPDKALVGTAEQLAKLNDNYRDPRWIMAFINYGK